MAAEQTRTRAADRDLRLHEIDHFTVPVRDFNVARKFYADILGGIVTQEVQWFGASERPGGFAAVQLFAGSGHLVLLYQPGGQPGWDQVHPCHVFAAPNARQLDDVIVRLREAEVPSVLMTPDDPGGAPYAPARLYFRDPDGNQLAVGCPSYPMSDRVHVGPFDPSLQQYRWAEWRARVPDGGGPPGEPLAGHTESVAAGSARGSTATAEAGTERSGRRRAHAARANYGSAEAAWRISGIDTFTLPVRSLSLAELFYCQVLGAEMLDRQAVETGGRRQEALRLRACRGGELALVQQDYGWYAPDCLNPHWAFGIPGADVDVWLDHLATWGVPCALICRRGAEVDRGKPTRVELHFLDPDGNQMELVAWDYPFSDRIEGWRYNPWKVAYSPDSWPRSH